jgi:hypothetical protein
MQTTHTHMHEVSFVAFRTQFHDVKVYNASYDVQRTLAFIILWCDHHQQHRVHGEIYAHHG